MIKIITMIKIMIFVKKIIISIISKYLIPFCLISEIIHPK